MPVYTPPALNAVDFALVARTPESVAPYVMTLTSYTVPALNAVDFALVTYTQPDYNTIDFEFVSVSSPVTVNPGTGELTIVGFAPVANIAINVFTGLGELTITGFRPAILASENANLYPGTGEIVLSGFVPGIFGDSLRGTFKQHRAVRGKRSFGWSRR